MEPALRLARSAAIACRLVEALARGAVPGDGSHDNRLAEAVAVFTQIDPAQLTATRRAILGGNRFRENLVNAAATWAEAVDQAFLEGRPLPPVLEAVVDGVGPGSLDPLEAQVYARICTGTEAVPPAGRHPRRLLLAAGTGALAVALVAWLVVRSLGPENSDLPFSAGGFSPVCDGTVFPDAPAYRGGAPHPTVVFSTDYNVQLSGKWSTVQSIYNEKNGFSDAWKASDPRTIQAAACIDLDGDPHDTIKQCPYNDSARPEPTDLPMYRGEFTITLYELRTGKKLHQAHITGEYTNCPKIVPVGANHVYSSPSPQQYKDAIGRFVDG